MRITAIAGGVGASKFLEGLCRVAAPEKVTIIVNTGDDVEMFGLYIAPDLDIVTYTLAGIVNPATGWGIADDTFHCLERLLRYTGEERWFNLGDRDLATHLFRTARMRAGGRLSEAADLLRTRLGVKSRILPMTDTHVPTTIVTEDGEMHFQEYLVRRRAQPRVRGIRFENMDAAGPAPGVREAILEADAIIVCPSNPLISIGPVLAVPGVRDLLRETPAGIAAISPIVGGASLKGPTDKMMAELGMEVSAAQVARLYADFLDVYVLDSKDADAGPEIEALGPRVVATNTVMSGREEKAALARATLAAFDGLAGGGAPE
ncbi:MAG: 2-phospho-L-lactate transferase [Blastocatellia bacterium]